jgi:signal transduction histidine kinase
VQRLSLQAVELGELAERVRDELGPGERIDVRAAGPVHALADSAAVLRILRILVDNARVHGEGAISIDLRTGGTSAIVGVQDEGPGLPEAHREHLFERFVRGPDAQGRAGSGLGLAIARGLAEAMDGRLDAVGGARVELTLRAWSDYRAGAGAGDAIGAGAVARLGTSQAASTASRPTVTDATKAAV